MAKKKLEKILMGFFKSLFLSNFYQKMRVKQKNRVATRFLATLKCIIRRQRVLFIIFLCFYLYFSSLLYKQICFITFLSISFISIKFLSNFYQKSYLRGYPSKMASFLSAAAKNLLIVYFPTRW